MGRLEKSINRQRGNIEAMLVTPLKQVANLCEENWSNRVQLDLTLNEFLKNKTDHRCSMLYAIDKHGKQCSSNISGLLIDDTIVGQDLSRRPYLEDIDTSEDYPFVLSEVYIDKQSRKPCITALHSVKINGHVQGYIAADFDLNNLSLKNVDDDQLQSWRQIKGDPSIRGGLFQQTRVHSEMDEHLEEVLNVVESLITEQGIFHAKLHFSSSRATLWPYDDPYHYRLHVLDEIINPKVCLVYAKMAYPKDAAIPASMVPKVLAIFKSLREADETIYLRAASLNIMNGLVGLNFSCDGSHYLPVEDFLDRDGAFWFSQ